jgi:integrase
MSSTKIRESLRLLECAQDIPPKVRQEWLTDALQNITHPPSRKYVLEGIKRLKGATKRPKYPVLYNVQPLLDLAFGDQRRKEKELHLVDRLLLQLRLTTMMRSGDVANLVWAIFTHEGEFYVKCTGKTGQVQTFRVSGSTRNTLLQYVHFHRLHPALFLFSVHQGATFLPHSRAPG